MRRLPQYQVPIPLTIVGMGVYRPGEKKEATIILPERPAGGRGAAARTGAGRSPHSYGCKNANRSDLALLKLFTQSCLRAPTGTPATGALARPPGNVRIIRLPTRTPTPGNLRKWPRNPGPSVA